MAFVSPQNNTYESVQYRDRAKNGSFQILCKKVFHHKSRLNDRQTLNSMKLIQFNLIKASLETINEYVNAYTMILTRLKSSSLIQSVVSIIILRENQVVAKDGGRPISVIFFFRI